MNFEEKFPSLKASPYAKQGFYKDIDIENACLDKQKVREIIDKVCEFDKGEYYCIDRNILFKELGL